MMKEDVTKSELNSSSLAEGDVVVVSENGNGEGGKPERRGSGSSASGDSSKAGDSFDDNAKWHQSKLWRVTSFILVLELFERMCYYTIAGTQRNFYMNHGYSAANATSISEAFACLAYLIPILGAWLADTRWGRYKTILVFLSVYVVGVFMAAGAVYPTFSSGPMFLVAMFCFIAPGTGGIKPNVPSFGSDQFDPSIPREARHQEMWWSYFYWAVNLGAAVVFGYLTTLTTSGGGIITKEYGFFATYTMSGIFLVLGSLSFLAGTRRYTYKEPGGDAVVGFGHYLWQMARTSFKGAIAFSGWVMIAFFVVLSIAHAFVADKDTRQILSYVCLGMAAYSVIVLSVCHMNNKHMDKVADHPSKNLSVSDVKAMLDIVPMVIIVNLGFMIIYNCMNGPMQSQTCQSNIMVTSTSQVNGNLLTVADCIAIIVVVPLFEHIVYPLIAKAKGSQVTITQKMIAGYICAIIAAIVAIVLEYARRSSSVTTHISDCAPPGIYMSSFSGFPMILPFFLIGAGEVLVNPPLLHFIYDQVPPRARSLAQAFNLLVIGSVSNSITSAQMTAMSKYYTDNLNDGHIEYIYYVCIAGSLVAIPCFVYFFRQFQYKDYAHSEEDKAASDGPSNDTSETGKQPSTSLSPMDAINTNSQDDPITV